MPRYVAFLRGVMPGNCAMADLRRSFEAAGFANVQTVIASGNVVFDARKAAEPALQRRCEAAMQQGLGRSFGTLVREAAYLTGLLQADPFAAFRLPPDAKRIVTFLREPPVVPMTLPIALERARILGIAGREAFIAYQPQPGNPVFMTLIEKTFGKDVTTRTWDTVRQCAGA